MIWPRQGPRDTAITGASANNGKKFSWAALASNSSVRAGRRQRQKPSRDLPPRFSELASFILKVGKVNQSPIVACSGPRCPLAALGARAKHFQNRKSKKARLLVFRSRSFVGVTAATGGEQGLLEFAIRGKRPVKLILFEELPQRADGNTMLCAS